MRKPTRSVITEEIYDIIKEQILTSSLKPGEKINIDHLARQLDVSNIPVRESLSRLAAEGLVISTPFKGMFVTHMSLQELDEIFELRQSLELLALRKASSSLNQEELEKLLASWKAFTIPADQPFDEALQTIVKMNEQFHGLYLERCGNKTLKQLIENYMERIQRYHLVLHTDLQKELLQTELNEHLKVLESLAAGRQEEALSLLEDHLRHSHRRTRELFSNQTNNSDPAHI